MYKAGYVIWELVAREACFGASWYRLFCMNKGKKTLKIRSPGEVH